MEIYLLAAFVVVAINVLPAFAPPTWMVLVFFLLNYQSDPIALVIIGVMSATFGRAILAWYFRKFAHLVPTRFSRNMEYAGHYFTKKSSNRYALLAIFLISPISSAQLFEAAGLMKTIALRPLLIAFAIGRTLSYSTYLAGAVTLAATNFGDLLIHQLKSPWAIASQIALIAGLAVLGAIDWQAKLHRRSEK